jgi:hypothetical protein
LSSSITNYATRPTAKKGVDNCVLVRYKEDALWSSPFYYNLGGGFNGVLSFVVDEGVSWLGTSSDDAYSADVFVANGFDYGEHMNDRGAGLQIRCILRPVVHALEPLVGRVDGIRIASLGY